MTLFRTRGPYRVRDGDYAGSVSIHGFRSAHVAEVWNGGTGDVEVARLNAQYLTMVPELVEALRALIPWAQTSLRPAADRSVEHAKDLVRHADALTGPPPPEKPMTRTRRARGFTLIEVMIVIAIIGILAAIALPAYMNYTTRAQISEGLTLAGRLKVAMTETFANSATWPDSTANAGSGASAGRYVESIEASAGVILITYGRQVNSAANGAVLALAPGVNASGQILWSCGKAPRQEAGVTWQGDAASLTTVAHRYLPAACRSSTE